MNRRTFTKLTLAGTLGAAHGVSFAEEAKKGTPFKSKFAPHFNLLPTGPKDLLDQMKFAHDLGFRAWEENWLSRRWKKDTWEKVGEFCKDNKWEIGVSVITGGQKTDFTAPTDEQMAKLKKDMEVGIELSKCTGQTNMTFIPGFWNEEKGTREEQIKAAVPTMHKLCDMVEEHGIICALEPLSHNVGGGKPLIRSFADGHLLAKLVNRKSCKLLADYFHEGQIGNGPKLVENTNATWDQVSYIQYGDSPGRKEPGTGSLDYVAVTKLLRDKGYTGAIGMEHGAKGKEKEGLDALLAAYRKIDA